MEEPIEFNLSSETLDESFLSMFGGVVKSILGGMFGMGKPNVKLKGKKSDIKAFMKTIESEKKYMQNYMDLGLDNPQTFRSKGALDSAISKFERKTGLKWPLK